MKKILALALALTMSLGMVTVTMAASKPKSIKLSTQIYTLSGKTMSEATNNEKLTPGKTYYMPIISDDTEYNKGKLNITSVGALSAYRIRMRASEGSKAMGNCEFVVKDVTSANFLDDKSKYSSTKQAFLAINTKNSYSNTDIDVVMDGGIYATDGYIINGSSSIEGLFTYTVGYRENMADFSTTVSDDSPLVNFADIDSTSPIEIYFAKADSNLRFLVNAKGQTPLFLRYSNDAKDTKYANIADKYPDATLDFHLFEGTKKTFKRTGELYLPAVSIEKNGRASAPYIYEIEDNKLKEIKPTYKTEQEEFCIKTNKLGNYMISDMKLSSTSSSSGEEETEESKSSSSSSSKKEEDDYVPPTSKNPGAQVNPDTGVTTYVGLASALFVAAAGAVYATTFINKRNKK
ncbi:MAG: hypothetical protein RR251_05135 [Hydrogenoanaerobacterium sp.]